VTYIFDKDGKDKSFLVELEHKLSTQCATANIV